MEKGIVKKVKHPISLKKREINLPKVFEAIKKDIVIAERKKYLPIPLEV